MRKRFDLREGYNHPLALFDYLSVEMSSKWAIAWAAPDGLLQPIAGTFWVPFDTAGDLFSGTAVAETASESSQLLRDDCKSEVEPGQ